MPTERFLNLPEEKRTRIVNAAMAEMSRVPFDEVSINKIVQAADIPRGSFYQYFTDKTDMLDYIMVGYRNSMKKIFREKLGEGNGDIFDMCVQALQYTVDFGTSGNNYSFCKHVFSQLSLNEDACYKVIEHNASELLQEFMPVLQLEKLRYQASQDLENVVEMLLVLLRRAIARIFADISLKDTVLEDFEKQLNMIKYGIFRERGGE